MYGCGVMAAEAGRIGWSGPTAEPVDERIQVLEAALDHVVRFATRTPSGIYECSQERNEHASVPQDTT